MEKKRDKIITWILIGFLVLLFMAWKSCYFKRRLGVPAQAHTVHHQE